MLPPPAERTLTMKFGVIRRISNGFFPYQAWPSVARDDNGILYAACSGHRLAHVCPFGKNYLYISRDEGESWEGPIVANDTCLDDRDAGLLAWGNGNLILSWFNHPKELYDAREASTPALQHPLSKAAREVWKTLPEDQYCPGSFIRRSCDGGKTWTDPVQVPVTAPHGPIRRKDGSLFYLGKVFQYPDENYPNGCICAVESRDNGLTWQKLGVMEFPEGILPSQTHEPHAVELPDGSILGTIRVHGETYAGKSTTFTALSSDGGKTWSTPQEVPGTGIPAHLLLHSSGILVMTHGRRYTPRGVYARISRDGGKTWSQDIMIGPEAPDWDLGYPASVELSDGSVFTVYYQKYQDDSYASVLYTKWNLSEMK